MARVWPALDVGIEAHDDRIDLLQAALIDYGITAVNEDVHSWRVFFRDEAERNRAVAGLRASFNDLDVTPVDVDDENWAARSQAALRAVRVGAFLVAPPWDVSSDRDAKTIIIHPSMGFGTGHHATTRLCLAALQQLDTVGRTVIDVGTGSGVLAIAASLLGAISVSAFDDDADAIASARENLDVNPRAHVDLAVADLRSGSRAPCDIVLANLTGGLLTAAASELRQLTKPGGRLILSGFMLSEEAEVLRAFAPLGVEHRGDEEEWVCVTLR